MDLDKKEELLNAVKNSLKDAEEIVDEIGNRFMECARLLRIEQSEKVFNDLSIGMDNLRHLNDFIKELKNGLEHLGASTEPLAYWDRSIGMFKEMLSAFEKKDWINLADLIQYELDPILAEGRKGFAELKEKLGV